MSIKSAGSIFSFCGDSAVNFVVYFKFQVSQKRVQSHVRDEISEGLMKLPKPAHVRSDV